MENFISLKVEAQLSLHAQLSVQKFTNREHWMLQKQNFLISSNSAKTKTLHSGENQVKLISLC